MSGRDIDCTNAGPAPLTQTICHGSSGCQHSPAESQLYSFSSCATTGDCEWQVGVWSYCSSSCGNGISTRQVVCESGFDGDCLSDKPNISETCFDNTGCGWLLSNWSLCSNACGSGKQHRTARCETDNNADCSSPGPATERDCNDTSNCSWVTGIWSDCNASCGHGMRHRTVACLSGLDMDCSTSRPASHETCVVTPSCQWQVSNWTQCSNACGKGTRSRKSFCPSGYDGDCLGAVPPVLEDCSSSSGCDWYVSDWSACSEGCGNGTATRTVLCPSGADSECPGVKPEESKICSSTLQCEWLIGEWSSCLSQCGHGIQIRNVTCPSGYHPDCPGSGPPTQQSCHTFSGCTWLIGNWSECSSSCGPGTKSRVVQCTSDNDGDCSHLEKPIEEQACENIDGSCNWVVSEWGECSATYCGSSGTRSRSVSCPSAFGDAACSFPRPEATEYCILRSPTQPCPWRTFNWSGCQSVCGSGVEVREITCSSVNVSDCFDPKPASMRVCENSVGCGWTVGPWSACSSTCGAGLQIRTISCLGENCEGQGPSKVQPCYATESCEWVKEDWSDCGASCGSGLKSRKITCSSGVDEDCALLPKPADQMECQGSSCDWVASSWSLCSVLCGVGSQYRSVSCFSGHEADCDFSVRPVAIRSCNETAGCLWKTSSWGACSNSCGHGIQQRGVWCPGGFGFDCDGSMPVAEKTCSEFRGCNWTVGSWSACSTECGDGLQQRSVSCAKEGACVGDTVDTIQSCRSDIGCNWVVSPWSACSSACGEGLRTRSVVCEGGDAQACSGTKPTDAEACRDVAGCHWRVSDWSSCDGNCAPQSRLVDCPTGNDGDCAGAVPETVRHCNHVSCTSNDEWETVDVQLVFVFRQSPSEEQETDIVEVVRRTFAEVLQVEPSRLIVKVASERRLDSQSRRLNAELKLLVQISHASAADLAFVSLEKGQQHLMAKINRGFAQEGLPTYLTSSIRKISPTKLSPPALPFGNSSSSSGSASTEENVPTDVEANESGVSGVVVLMIVAACVAIIGVLSITLRRHWRARIKQTTNVHRSIEKAHQKQQTGSRGEDSSDSDPGSPCGEKKPSRRSISWWQRALLRWTPFSTSRRKHMRLQPEEPVSTVQVAPSPSNSACLSVVAQSPFKKRSEYAFALECVECGTAFQDDDTLCVSCGSRRPSACSSREPYDDHSNDGISTRPPSSYSQFTAMSALRSLAHVEDDNEATTPPDEPAVPVCVRTPPRWGRNGSSLQEGEGEGDGTHSQIPQLSAPDLLDALRSPHARRVPAVTETRILEANLVPGSMPTAERQEAVNHKKGGAMHQSRLPPPLPPPPQGWQESS